MQFYKPQRIYCQKYPHFISPTGQRLGLADEAFPNSAVSALALPSMMNRRPFRRALFACFGLLVVKLLLVVFSPRLNGPRGTEVGIQPSESAPAAPQFDPEEFVLGLAEPRLFFEGLGGVARKFLPDENGDSLLEQLRLLFLLEKGRVDSRLAPLPRLRPHSTDKLIVVTAGVGVDPWRLKREAFVAENCPINNCYLMEDLTELPPGVQRPDVVLYKLPTGYLNVLSQHRTSDEVGRLVHNK